MTIIPIVLAGGSGTRLWPLSRRQYAKQFISFDGEWSLLQVTLQRLAGSSLYGPPLVLTSEEARFIVAQQAEDAGVKLSGILLEPSARNTAPALAAACFFIEKHLKGAQVVHVLPSDQRLSVNGTLEAAVKAGAEAAATGKLVTFGIEPSAPATGYGYIEVGEPISDAVSSITRFVEKPDLETAQGFLDAGGFCWNSGMFMFLTRDFLDEIARFEPAMHETIGKSVANARDDLDFTRLEKTDFEAAKSISVDYAIFEKTDKCVVVPTAIDWSDLGTWDAIHEMLPKDADGNSMIGQGMTVAAQDNLIISGNRFVAACGVDNLAIVATDDAILVSDLNRSEEVKALVTALGTSKDHAHLSDQHTLTYRPWGGYASILAKERFQIKRLFVKPGARLSLQKHHHRSEHWVVVTGTAEVTIDGTVAMLSENQSTYIPVGAVHRLANPGKITLEVIEVQIGSYLGEDDIIRIEDEFGRT